jgi:hypothetical protein
VSDAVQQVVVAAAVIGSIVYLILRGRKKAECGGGCGTSCAAKNLGTNGDDADRKKTPMGS